MRKRLWRPWMQWWMVRIRLGLRICLPPKHWEPIPIRFCQRRSRNLQLYRWLRQILQRVLYLCCWVSVRFTYDCSCQITNLSCRWIWQHRLPNLHIRNHHHRLRNISWPRSCGRWLWGFRNHWLLHRKKLMGNIMGSSRIRLDWAIWWSGWRLRYSWLRCLPNCKSMRKHDKKDILNSLIEYKSHLSFQIIKHTKHRDFKLYKTNFKI